jgi:hypothetical protein
MSSVVEVTGKLDSMATELDELSKALAVTERKLEPVETYYEEALNDFETGCWDAHVKEEAKLPSAELRERLARRTMSEKMLTERAALLAKRKRLEKRIKALGSAIGAQRSILSALKMELEAVS